MPINPEWIPETALLLAGVIAGVFALRLLFMRHLRQAAKVGAASLALFTLAFALGSLHSTTQVQRRLSKPLKAIVLLPATSPKPDEQDPEAGQSMSLLLGGVLLRVAPSNRYALSVDGEQFLVIDSLKSGLTVSCEVAALEGGKVPATHVSRSPWLAARIIDNWFAYSARGVDSSRPDAHTLLVQEKGKDLFRMHYAEPRKIEIMGQFFGGRSTKQNERTPLTSLKKGIHWNGGDVLPGTVDLRLQGQGKIDFQHSGLIQVLPY